MTGKATILIWFWDDFTDYCKVITPITGSFARILQDDRSDYEIKNPLTHSQVKGCINYFKLKLSNQKSHSIKSVKSSFNG